MRRTITLIDPIRKAVDKVVADSAFEELIDKHYINEAVTETMLKPENRLRMRAIVTNEDAELLVQDVLNSVLDTFRDLFVNCKLVDMKDYVQERKHH